MTHITRRGLAGITLGGLALAATGARAAENKPILTVAGNITRPNAGETATFDRASLEALGPAGFDTTTPWYTGPVRFDGIRMTSLMDAVGASGTTVRAIALNDYTTDIPMADFARFGTLLALRRNGEYMPIRDKGPLFIVYPFDSTTDLQTHQYYGRSAWQVTRLIIV